MPLFEVAVIEKATDVGKQNGLVYKLILSPTSFVANDRAGAILQAGILLAKNSTNFTAFEPQRAEVQVCPFAKELLNI